ncbi:class I SAM-dependent methyltransferase [Geodermatophilus sp. SYSU D01036]
MITTSTFPVHPGNLEQLRAWDGEEGAYWAAHADAFDRAVAGFDAALFDAAAIGPADRVLDVGCGTGGTTRAAARRAPAGAVLGVDLSAAMLAVARRRAAEEGLSHVDFVQVDAQVHPFPPRTFDVAISRTAAMFFADRVAALANVGRALVPGGRLSLLVWQPPERNEWFLELTGALAAGRQLPTPPPDAPHPFTLADPAVAREVVSAAGYTDITVEGIDGVMDLGGDRPGAHDFVLGLLGWMLEGLDRDARDRAVGVLRRSVDAHSGPDGVRFGAAVWLLAARRTGTPGRY